jgi:hypothetical protein
MKTLANQGSDLVLQIVGAPALFFREALPEYAVHAFIEAALPGTQCIESSFLMDIEWLLTLCWCQRPKNPQHSKAGWR